mgnify:CR=1 FL=1
MPWWLWPSRVLLDNDCVEYCRQIINEVMIHLSHNKIKSTLSNNQDINIVYGIRCFEYMQCLHYTLMTLLVVELYIRGERSICKLVILHIKALKEFLLWKPLKFLTFIGLIIIYTLRKCLANPKSLVAIHTWV